MELQTEDTTAYPDYVYRWTEEEVKLVNASGLTLVLSGRIVSLVLIDRM